MDHTQLAVRAALEGRWKDAVLENLIALKDNPQDTEILNRLGRAYMETGQKAKAQTTYTQVLKLDKFNTIAQKNLLILKNTKGEAAKSAIPSNGAAMPVFLEEPGVTKTLSLIRLGDIQILGKLHPGDQVKLVSREHTVCIVNNENQYLGRLPDDLSSRLRIFIQAGNTYLAWIRSVELGHNSKIPANIKIFIKEVDRAAKFRQTPSFPLTEKLTYAAFTPPELIHEEKPDVSATEEQEENVTRDDSEDTSNLVDNR